MQNQNYKNHTRFVPMYHFITGTLLLSLVIGSFMNLYNSSDDNLYSASLICLMSLILVSIFLFARLFALKAQDRAIRAEENFRHFILTNRTLDSRLTMSQMVALRFASDEEFPQLAQKAADQKMTSADIKKAIKNWRGDYYRV
jgi:tellurite resistance protein TehA-like permease